MELNRDVLEMAWRTVGQDDNSKLGDAAALLVGISTANSGVLLGNNSSSPHSSSAVSLALVLQRKRQGAHLTSEDFRYLQGDLNDFSMLNLQLYIHLLGVIGHFSEQTLPNSGVPKLFSKRARFDEVNMREGQPKFLSFFLQFYPQSCSAF
ncbi:uncharacterized protein LOC114598025 [Podarcis muralis]